MQKYMLVYQPPRSEAGQPPLEFMGFFGPEVTDGDILKREKIKENRERRKGSWFAAPMPKDFFRL